jgi:menaquinone-dependent protoporphyrinogen oxidase
MNIALIYASRHGHTATVAERVAAACAREGVQCDVFAASDLSSRFSIEQYDGLIVAGPLYYGRHSRKLEDFALRNHRLSSIPSAMLSISASAISEKTLPDAEAAVDSFESRTGWHPDKRLCVAGALAYRQYNFLTRWLMKRIAAKHGGETDTSRNHVYTNWTQLDEFVRTFISDIRALEGEARAHALA